MTRIMTRENGRTALKTLLVSLAIGVSTAFAADSAVPAAITELQGSTITNIGLVVTAAFAVLVAALVPDIGLGLAKKWIKKGAS